MSKEYVTPLVNVFVLDIEEHVMAGSEVQLTVGNESFDGEGRVKEWGDMWEDDDENE